MPDYYFVWPYLTVRIIRMEKPLFTIEAGEQSLRNEFAIRIGGAAGDGIASTGEIFSRTCSRSGLHVFGMNSYQSAIRGGHVWFQVRAGNEKVTNQGDRVDIVVALNSETAELHAPFVSKGGVIVYDKEKVKLNPNLIPQNVTILEVPLGEIARKFDKNPIIQNTVALGVSMLLLGLGFDVFSTVLTDAFGKKKQAIIDANLNAAKAGYEFAKSNFQSKELNISLPQDPKLRLLLTGNQAIALGAVMAGCKFYAAYPMTPASSILHWMAAHAAPLKVVVKQAEDELAVINMGIGAAHAGVRAMVGTSGGGFSLMSEALGLAGMTETPIVIIEAQRAGPSTGLPTKTEQGDLNMMMGASQGDFPRIVLAPLTVEDAYYSVIEAFNLAERFQCPVIVASDLFISEHIETVDSFNSEIMIDRGELITSSPEEKYNRFKITETGISPRAIPGTPNAVFVAASDEHQEDGVVISDVLSGIPRYVKEREKQMEKRMRKMEVARNEILGPKFYGEESGALTLVCWGSTYGAATEAAKILTKEGVKTNVYALRNIMPLNWETVKLALTSAKRLICVECNYSGQMARTIRAETGIEIKDKFLKYDGEPIYPLEVVDYAKRVISN